MILLALALLGQAQWTGPRTEEYRGPGYFCGGGYAIRLMRGDRALVLPQSAGAGIQGVRVILGGREVNIWSGAPRGNGRMVARYGRIFVTQQSKDQAVVYTVSDPTDFGLLLTSRAFRGLRNDAWFFQQVNFGSGAENHVPCLAAVSE